MPVWWLHPRGADLSVAPQSTGRYQAKDRVSDSRMPAEYWRGIQQSQTEDPSEVGVSQVKTIMGQRQV